MNFLDILLLVILGIFLVRGFFKGLIKEVISLASVTIGVTLATKYHGLVAPHLEVYLSNEKTIQIISWIIIFFAIIALAWILARILSNIMDMALLGWLDRLLGGIFGALEGAVIGITLLLILQSYMPEADFLKESQIAPKAQPAIEILGDLTPESVRESLKKKGITIPSGGGDKALDDIKNSVNDTLSDAVNNATKTLLDKAKEGE